MPDPTPAIIGAAVALVLMLLALVLRGEEARSPLAITLAAVAPVAAAIAAYYAQGLALSVPPKQFIHASLFAGVAAVPLGVGAARSRGAWPSAVAAAAFFAVSAALFFFFTETLHERYWNGDVAIYVVSLAGLAALTFAARLGAEAMGRTTEAALGTGLVALAASPALGWSGTGVSALTIAAVSASAGLFGLLLVARTSWRTGAASLGRAAATGQSLLIAGILGNGVLYAETPKGAGAMLMSAPLLLLLPGRSLIASLVRLVLIAAVAGGAAWLSKGEPNPYGY